VLFRKDCLLILAFGFRDDVREVVLLYSIMEMDELQEKTEMDG